MLARRTNFSSSRITPRRVSTRWRVMSAMLVVALIASFSVMTTSAVHKLGSFELDGDAVDNPGTAGSDWDQLKAGGGAPLEYVFIPDASNSTSDDIFDQGGSKDIHDIPNWKWTNQKPQAKNDIVNAYAAAYLHGSDLILYYGLDRYSNNGDAQVGFWFTQADVAPLPNKTFSGQHTENDLLVQAEFSNGGDRITIRTYKWQNGGLVESANILNAECSEGSDTDSVCAEVNEINAVAPWPYSAASSTKVPAGTFPPGTFFEGGINISALFGGGTPCFTTFIAETRSSNSFSSTLSDFAGGDFDLCAASINIGPSAVNEVGDSHTFDVTVAREFGTSSLAPPTGTQVRVDLAHSTASGDVNVDTSSTCDVYVADALVHDGVGTNVAGQCSVTFNSTTAGQVTGHASASFSAGGQTFNVQTNGQNGSSGDAIKDFVDASIAVAPSEVNEVNDDHVFTVTVKKDLGDGNGLVAAAGVNPTVTLTYAGGADASGTITANTCDDVAGTDNAGECTVTINSSVAATITAEASVSLDLGITGGELVIRSTTGNSGPGGNDGAEKVYVDLQIAVGEDGINSIGERHTFTVTAQQDVDGGGFENVTNGTHVDVTLTGSNGILSTDIIVTENTCDANGGASGTVDGQCSVTFYSDVAGTVTGKATVSLDLGLSNGELVTRSTGDSVENPNAVKTFLDGTLVWLKHDQNGQLLGGATFEVCRTHNWNSDTEAFDPIETPDCHSIVDAEAELEVGADPTTSDQDPIAGQFKLEKLILGRYTIQETEAPEGYGADFERIETVDLSTADTSNVGEGPVFVNTLLFKMFVITCNQSTNEVVNSEVSGTFGDSNPAVQETLGVAAPDEIDTLVAQLCGIDTDTDVVGAAEYYDLIDAVYDPSVDVLK